MGLWDKLTGTVDKISEKVNTISGKSVEDKVFEYSEIYGEVLLGVNRELEKQKSILHSQEQQFNSQIQQLKEEVDHAATGVQGLKNQINKMEFDMTAGFDSFRSSIEYFQSEAAALPVFREHITQLVKDVEQSINSTKNAVADQVKQTQQLKWICGFSFLFAIGIGMALWLLR